MNRRRELLIAFGLAPLAALYTPFVRAQQAKLHRIGFLGATSASGWADRVEALRAGLRELGYVEGRNLVIEYRWAEGKYERLPELAAELVRSKVDVIVTHGTPGTLAAKRATTAIPIVMAVTGDAVAVGLVASLARPGGNITGSTFFNPEIAAKRLDLLKEIFPRTRQVAVLLNPDNLANGPNLQAMETAAGPLKMELQRFWVRGPDEFESAFSAIAGRRVDAVVVNEDAVLIANARAIVDLAARQKISLIGAPEFAQAGGLIAYGVNIPDIHRRAAYFVDRILKGAKPGDLPIERATKFETILNLKTARAFGIKLPQSVLIRADRVIE